VTTCFRCTAPLEVFPVIDAARADAEMVPGARVVVGDDVVAVVAVVAVGAVGAVVGRFLVAAALVVGRIGERRITAATCSA
jgi:hypothetical protein